MSFKVYKGTKQCGYVWDKAEKNPRIPKNRPKKAQSVRSESAEISVCLETKVEGPAEEMLMPRQSKD